LECIAEIEGYVKGFTEIKFAKSSLIQDAVTRRLEILGQDVKNLPEEIKTNHPSVPWKNIAGSRDILAHDYFQVDYGIIWETVRKDLPLLKKEIKKILKRKNIPQKSFLE